MNKEENSDISRLVEKILNQPVKPKVVRGTGKDCYDMRLLMADFDRALEDPNSEPLKELKIYV